MKQKYIVTIHKIDKENSDRRDGTWASLTGSDKDTLIHRAINLRRQWQSENYGPYTISVGILTEIVETQVPYKLIPML